MSTFETKNGRWTTSSHHHELSEDRVHVYSEYEFDNIEHVEHYIGDNDDTTYFSASVSRQANDGSDLYANGEIRSYNMSMYDQYIDIFISRNRGRVVVHPNHPRYDEFDFPEEEVEPSGYDEEPIMGKIIAHWDTSTKTTF